MRFIERKLAKYEGLKNEIGSNGWTVKVFAVEVGCRGFASRSLRSYLTAIGGSNRKIKGAVKECCEVAERDSVEGWDHVCCPRANYLLYTNYILRGGSHVPICPLDV